MKKRFLKKLILGLFSINCLVFGGSFPEKNLEMIVPYSAGGGTDQVARFIGKTTEKYLNQPINIINKTGAGGAVGMTAGAKTKANGYNITMVTVELSILPHLGGMKVDYSDFKPLLQLNSSPAAITVRADSKFNTLNDLIEYAKKSRNNKNRKFRSRFYLAFSNYEIK